MARLQNTPQFICVSLNNNVAYWFSPRFTKDSKLRGILDLQSLRKNCSRHTKYKTCCKTQVPFKFSTCSIVREEAIFNLLHKDATCKLGPHCSTARVASETRLLIGSFTCGNRTSRVGFYLGHFILFSVNSPCLKIDLSKTFRGKIVYTGKCNFPQGNLTFTQVKLPHETTAIVFPVPAINCFIICDLSLGRKTTARQINIVGPRCTCHDFQQKIAKDIRVHLSSQGYFVVKTGETSK